MVFSLGVGLFAGFFPSFWKVGGVFSSFLHEPVGGQFASLVCGVFSEFSNKYCPVQNVNIYNRFDYLKLGKKTANCPSRAI